MITKHQLTKDQRELLRKARLGLVPDDFNESMKALVDRVKPEDWADVAIATFLLAEKKYGRRFGNLYAGYLCIYSEKRPRRESDREARKYRALMVRIEAWRKRRKPA